ncbi:MAG: 23S rRNA (guanosine(2251)-2'-O)-methyltransferase RlmB [Devosiaceae bacterium]|nr:23S rRNA (guanosine(2251)-2'-O)-methyltransferase RlmB [Devosiaceae bacterium]
MSQKPIFRRQKKRPATAAKVQKQPASHHIYGLHAVRAALKNQRRKKIALHCTANALEKLSVENENIAENVDLQISSPRDLDRLVGSEAVHQGLVLKVMPLPRFDLKTLSDSKLVIILDQITDPHNVGAILRTACAFNADAVITTARHAPKETGVLAKSASGALDIIPVIEVGNLGETIKLLKKQAIWCVGLDSQADLSLSETGLDHNIALILGAEGKGLRQKTRQLCDQMFRLDMPGEIKSLNVSNAAAIAMFALTSTSK